MEGIKKSRIPFTPSVLANFFFPRRQAARDQAAWASLTEASNSVKASCT